MLHGRRGDRSTRRLALAAWLLIAALAGCIDRDRVNPNCEWTGDAAFPIDSHDAADQDHLVRDAQLAEELATRYADAEHERRFGYSGHGGLIEQGRVYRDCMARLVARIQTNHGVTSDEVQAARAHRDWRFDLPVAVLFLPLYWFAATVVCRGLARRFSADQPRVRIAATGLTSLVVGFLGLQAGQLWTAAWETVRVGNGHIGGFRMASRLHPWASHVGGLFVGAALLFCLIAASSRRIPHAFPAVAAMLAFTVLGVALVATFVQHAIGYFVAALVLLAIDAALWFAGRIGVDRPDFTAA